MTLATCLGMSVVRTPFCSDTLQRLISTPGIMLPGGMYCSLEWNRELLHSPPPQSPLSLSALSLSLPFPLPSTLRQFIVNLDGDVEIEVSSGEKRILRRGTVFFVEDVTGKAQHLLLTIHLQWNSSIIQTRSPYLRSWKVNRLGHHNS